mgnify:CR=1 FL=1
MSLPESLELLQSSAPLAPRYDLPFEPGREQRGLLARILGHVLDPGRRVTLAPGAAGTGKTTIILLLLRILLLAGLRVVVATPTHKARRRVEEALGGVGVEVVTHQSMWCGDAREEVQDGEEYADDLHLTPSEDRLLDYDVVVVDEASMLTEEDLSNLLSVLPDSCTVVGTGDHHQLPPVSGRPGFDWSDADAYGLTHVHRQAEGSPVLAAATAIRQQRVPFTWSPVARWRDGVAILKRAGVPSRWAGSVETGGALARMIRRHGGGLDSAVAITGTHASRVRVGDAARRALDLPPRAQGPAPGERVIARASAGGMTNALQAVVVWAQAQDFGERFGRGWIVSLDCEDGRCRTVGVLEQSWIQTDEPKYRGLIPFSIRMMLDRYVEEDEATLAIEIAGRLVDREADYLRRNPEADGAPEWLVDRWRAEACADRGAWGPWLRQRLAAIDTAYAITCHASQGSQWQEIIVVADSVDFVARDRATRRQGRRS